ncbi:MAG: ferritin-like domain-containing protein [Pyrinomonadaceae bacterium]|nr:ferritin-like domain-containing protein [Pyrinomonadaceae bacterium]
MKIDSLNTLLGEELKDIYSAEKQLLKALPKMAKNASSDELRTALEEHLEVTRGQVQRLEEVFQSLGKPAKAKTCKAMQGLIEEATDVMEEDAEDAVMDAGIIAAAQKVEHYEMASYGTVRTWARLCGEDEAAQLLQETLDEEGEADKRLTELAESFVNPEAEASGGEQASGASSKSSKGSSKSIFGKSSAGGVRR